MSFYKIRPKSGTKEQWESANTVLAEREIGYEYPDAGLGKGIVKMKMGDGVTPWNNLPYAQVVPITENDIINTESEATNKVPSAGYLKNKATEITSKILIRSINIVSAKTGMVSSGNFSNNVSVSISSMGFRKPPIGIPIASGYLEPRINSITTNTLNVGFYNGGAASHSGECKVLLIELY